jgi:hypothetical protein
VWTCHFTYPDPNRIHIELGLEGWLEPMALVKEWEKELAALAPSVQVQIYVIVHHELIDSSIDWLSPR